MTQMPTIRFDHVRKEYPNGTVAVSDLVLEAHGGELLVLVGPSGCGKSTSLRMVNRLIEPTSGTIYMDDQNIMEQDPVMLRRNVGYVIQDVGLFPHRNIRRNVATVPELLKWNKKTVAARVDELLTLVGLAPDEYGSRYPHELSGGQRQRVGVARALASRPHVLLMDEPFGAVDPIARRHLQTEFQTIHNAIGTTTLFVTHDIDEAIIMGDRIAVFSHGGRVERLAAPIALLANPGSTFVTEFIGNARGTRLAALGELTMADLKPAANLDSEAHIRLGMHLDEALSALALTSSETLPVADHTGAIVGELTAERLVHAIRRVAARV